MLVATVAEVTLGPTMLPAAAWTVPEGLPAKALATTTEPEPVRTTPKPALVAMWLRSMVARPWAAWPRRGRRPDRIRR